MTAARLRSAAAVLREVPNPVGCSCEDSSGVWFDRSICPPPCESMHNICEDCGQPISGCAWADLSAQPSPQDLATAAWLEKMDDMSASGNDIPAMRGRGLEEALAVADAVLNDREVAV